MWIMSMGNALPTSPSTATVACTRNVAQRILVKLYLCSSLAVRDIHNSIKTRLLHFQEVVRVCKGCHFVVLFGAPQCRGFVAFLDLFHL